jgi:hypothetical protein
MVDNSELNVIKYNPDRIEEKTELGNVYFRTIAFNIKIRPSNKLIKTAIAAYMYNDRLMRPTANAYIAPNKTIIMQIIKAQVEKGGQDAMDNVDRYWSKQVLEFRDNLDNIETINQMYDYVAIRYFNIYM